MAAKMATPKWPPKSEKIIYLPINGRELSYQALLKIYLSAQTKNWHDCVTLNANVFEEAKKVAKMATVTKSVAN